MERKVSYEDESAYINDAPIDPVRTLNDLRSMMGEHRSDGTLFLDYLLEGEFFEGKNIWVTTSSEIRRYYEKVLEHNPHLTSESPFGEFFNRTKVRVAGENDILLSGIETAPYEYQQQHSTYEREVGQGGLRRLLFGGGPAPKIAALLAQMSRPTNTVIDFTFDGAEQSNESASAHYEHINHANALNAEHNNGGLAILRLAIQRALFGEPDASVALHPDYHKVDLWPSSLRLRDIPLFLYNEYHGRLQRLKTKFGMLNDHDKSRLASKISTHILTHLESLLDVSFRLPDEGLRAFFVYISEIEHKNSYLEYEHLSHCPTIFPKKVSKETLQQVYGGRATSHIRSADVFLENHCIRHGFDYIVLSKVAELGGMVRKRTAIRELYFKSDGTAVSCCGVRTFDQASGKDAFVPVSALGLSLGPSARYRFARAGSLLDRISDRLLFRQPVPHQTIATGFTSQLLFRIKDCERFRIMPHTGLKQTHFVEVGRFQDLLIVKLTSGGNIGAPVYSRSYALGALASIFRILPPGCGLDFLGVVCAWPGTRGVNGSNNGQVVRLADNAAVRFGEGGTGMSKMATNAQTLIDLVGLPCNLPSDLHMGHELYRHTILDNRKLVGRRLIRGKVAPQFRT